MWSLGFADGATDVEACGVETIMAETVEGTGALAGCAGGGVDPFRSVVLGFSEHDVVRGVCI